MSFRTWHEVKPLAQKERDALAAALVTAPIDQVARLQAQVQTIDRFIAWFEAGTTENRLIGDAAPIAGY